MAALKKRVQELDAAAPSKPTPPDAATDPTIARLRVEIEETKAKQLALRQEAAKLRKSTAELESHIDKAKQLNTAMNTLRGQVDRFRSEWKDVAALVGLDLDSMLNVQINTQPVRELISSRSEQRSKFADTLDPKVKDSLPARGTVLQKNLEGLEAGLDSRPAIIRNG